MIQVQNLTKTYGETVAVNAATFHVPAGEVLGFLGPNGAGKTTTMRVLTGYTPPTSGEVRVDGLDVAGDSREVRRRIGYLPEEAPIYGEMTVRSYVRFFAELRGVPRGAARRAAVDRALEECGLDKVAGRVLMNLSKGYRQRAALAQAVVGDPKVLILDEPTVGLDPAQVREIRRLIGGMAGRRTVILSTHILPEVSLTCSRVVIIHRGRIVADGAPGDIHTHLKRPGEILVQATGDRDKALSVLNGCPGVKSVEATGAGEYRVRHASGSDPRAELSRRLIGAGLGLLEVRGVGLSLEDVFLHLVGDVEGPAGKGSPHASASE